jgi:hypothetical protein
MRNELFLGQCRSQTTMIFRTMRFFRRRHIVVPCCSDGSLLRNSRLLRIEASSRESQKAECVVSTGSTWGSHLASRPTWFPCHSLVSQNINGCARCKWLWAVLQKVNHGRFHPNPNPNSNPDWYKNSALGKATCDLDPEFLWRFRENSLKAEARCWQRPS